MCASPCFLMFLPHKDHIDIGLLLRLTLPIFLELVLQLLVGNVDKVMVGNDYSATAINQANTILDMLAVSLSVLSAASLILISQYKGAKNKEKEQQIYVISFYFNLSVSLAIGVALSVLARPVLSAIHVQPEIMDEAVIYLRIDGGGLFLQAVTLSLSAYLRSNTYMKQCLFVAFLFNIINISGNALFLWGFGMKGAMAVAIPSVLSRLMGALILFYEVKKYLRISLSFRHLVHCRKTELFKMLKLGLPSCGESISYSFSQIVILAIINTFSTTEAVVKTYATMLAMCSYLFTSAVSQAMQILLGRALGAKKHQEAEELVIWVTLVSCLASATISAAIAIFSDNIFGLLTSNAEVIRLCRIVMLIDVALELGRAVNIVMVRALQTCGDVFFPTMMAIIFCWSIAVCGSWLLGSVMGLGIIGVWVAMAFDELCRAGIFIVRFRRGNWKKLSLVDDRI